ncbi:MAG: hypothetical protein Q8L71_09540 [Thiobacillus sp.]|nr:hypothetical protein [Thiobacillus sp.]
MAQEVDQAGPYAKNQRSNGDCGPEKPLPQMDVIAPNQRENSQREADAKHGGNQMIFLHILRDFVFQRARHNRVVSAM